MKRLTAKRRNWLKIRARNEHKKRAARLTPRVISRHIRVTLWKGDEAIDALSTRAPYKPPKVLCLDKNESETLAFFCQIRDYMHKLIKNGERLVHYRKKKRPKISGFYDFSRIEKISTAAALILIAEYQRIRLISDEVPPTVNLHEWNKDLFQELFELDFFGVVGISSEKVSKFYKKGDTVSMSVISDNRVNINKVAEGIDHLSCTIQSNKVKNYDTSISLNTSLTEAITNVRHHAYQNGFDHQYRHVGRWWTTGSANPETKILTVVLYDQGLSIPVTYPYRVSDNNRILDWLKAKLNPNPAHRYENDGYYIEAAVRYGASQTGEDHRGKGLPQMLEILNATGSGKLRIWSRGGALACTPNEQPQARALEHSVGGTLIEWQIKVVGDGNGR